MIKSIFLKYKWYIIIGAILAAGIAGFFIGRSQSVVITKTEYIKADPISGTVPKPDLAPVKQEDEPSPDLPIKRDTVWQTDSVPYEVQVPYKVVESVDTAAILNNYTKKNFYSYTLFDNDTLGKLDLKSMVQYNLLQSQDYTFTPIQKVITKERKRTVTPFVMGSYSSLNQAAAGVGIYIKNVGIGAKYVKDLNTQKTGYEGGIYIKF